MEENKLKVTLGLVPENAKGNAVSISEFSITYTQNPDCNSNSSEYQDITIKALNSGMGEDGWYYDIKTDNHWSISDADELVDLINDFKMRMEVGITKEKDIETY